MVVKKVYKSIKLGKSLKLIYLKGVGIYKHHPLHGG
jgi:hypothetical protein